MSKKIPELKPIVFRLGKNDKEILVWLNCLVDKHSEVIKSILYSRKYNIKEHINYKDICITEEVLKPRSVSISFCRDEGDRDIYEYIHSTKSYSSINAYENFKLKSRLLNIIKETMGPEVLTKIQEVISEYELNEISREDKIVNLKLSNCIQSCIGNFEEYTSSSKDKEVSNYIERYDKSVEEHEDGIPKQLVEEDKERSICVKFIKELIQNNIDVTEELIGKIVEIEKVIKVYESD